MRKDGTNHQIHRTQTLENLTQTKQGINKLCNDLTHSLNNTLNLQK